MFSAIRDGLLIGGSLVANTTDNSNIRLQKRRKRDIKKRLFLIPKLIFVFLVVFLLISIFFRSGNSVSTYTALNGKIEEYVLADGYIFMTRSSYHHRQTVILSAWQMREKGLMMEAQLPPCIKVL